MNTSDKIKALFENKGENVEVVRKKRFLSIIPYTRSYGWLGISGTDECWRVMLTSHRGQHFPLISGRPAYIIDFRKEDGKRNTRGFPDSLFYWTGACKTAISLWPVRKEAEAKQICDLMVSAIDTAYAFHIGDTAARTKAA